MQCGGVGQLEMIPALFIHVWFIAIKLSLLRRSLDCRRFTHIANRGP
jgi:hypothetical protein